jgi:hypothetical protein
VGEMSKMSELHIEMNEFKITYKDETETFQLPEDMFTDNPVFVDTSQEFDDDCGEIICVWWK